MVPYETFRDLRRCGLGFFVAGIVSRLSRADTFLVRPCGGRQVFVRPRQSDFDTLRQVFRDQEYRLPDSVTARVDREYEQICTSGMVPVIIDAGANIGAASVWFKARFPKAAVIAIEPDPDNAAMARMNVAGLQDVTVLEAAVGGATGFVALVPHDLAWAIKTKRADVGCDIVTIDQAVASIPTGKLLIAKIDIEGFEHDVFAGDLRWMDDVFAVYLEPHDWMLPGKGTSRSFQAAFGDRDFEILLGGENLIYVRRGPLAA